MIQTKMVSDVEGFQMYNVKMIKVQFNSHKAALPKLHELTRGRNLQRYNSPKEMFLWVTTDNGIRKHYSMQVWKCKDKHICSVWDYERVLRWALDNLYKMTAVIFRYKSINVRLFTEGSAMEGFTGFTSSVSKHCHHIYLLVQRVAVCAFSSFFMWHFGYNFCLYPVLNLCCPIYVYQLCV